MLSEAETSRVVRAVEARDISKSLPAIQLEEKALHEIRAFYSTDEEIITVQLQSKAIE